MAPLRALVLTIVLSAMAAAAGSPAWASADLATKHGVSKPAAVLLRSPLPRRPDGQLGTLHPSELLVVPNRNDASTVGRLALIGLALISVVITIARRRPSPAARRVPFREVTALNLSLRAPPLILSPSLPH